MALAEELPEILAFELDGVTQLPESELRDALLTRSPSWWSGWFWQSRPRLDEFVLEEDMERIAAFYRDRGYYEAQAEPTLSWNESRSEVRVRVAVTEGPPTHLEFVEIENARPAMLAGERWDAIVASVPLTIGQVFGLRDYRAAKQQLLQELADVGHAAPALEGGAEVDAVEGVARVAWRVDPGPRVRFGPIRVVGLERVDQEIVRRELVFAEGDPYTLRAQRKTQEQLFELGLFRSVAIEPERGADEAESGEPGADEAEAGEPGVDAEEVSWPIQIQLKERPPRTVRFGVGYGSEELYRVRAEWRHRNFLGDARLLNLRAQYNDLLTGLDARISQPYFFHPDARLEIDGYFRYETVPAYAALRTSLGFLVYRDFAEHWTLRGGYAFEFADVQARDLDTEEGSVRVSTLRTGIRRDSVDDPLEPRRGTSLDFSLEPSPEILGSTASWLTLDAEGRAFLPVRFAVLALRLRAGAIQPFAGSRGRDVPVFKRFYSGGSNSVRGYKYQKVGPVDADGDPAGGRSLLEGSLELRFPIWRRLSGAAFADAGLVDAASFRYPLNELLYSAGPGLRLRTPVGSLRIDVGFPLNRPDGTDLFRLHLAVGHTF